MFNSIDLQVLGPWAISIAICFTWIGLLYKDKKNAKEEADKLSQELKQANDLYKDMATKSTEALTLATKIIDDSPSQTHDLRKEIIGVKMLLIEIKTRLNND